MLTKTQLLYGINVDTRLWTMMTYSNTLRHKVQLAHNRITHLNTVNYMEKDSNNINDCYKAIQFNEELLGELQ